MYMCTFSFGLWLFLCIPSCPGQDAELLPLISDPRNRPLTMLWPTDTAFNALPEKRQKWLYRREHRDVLASYLKAHMIRDTKVTTSRLHVGPLPAYGSARGTLSSTLLVVLRGSKPI